ncbi:hypothetical protein AM571_PA00128 (plasmid) [Rhizobium etli 8C-3]|uniref:Uncharacterized protein n=1 Tax=Rhizobium etli 8C-3 TaxID=538025 RepID=A0A1L5PA14_RHIET|nr:hypothetical protein AM571_PA00128 [Rhizobium etli 8C-3]
MNLEGGCSRYDEIRALAWTPGPASMENSHDRVYRKRYPNRTLTRMLYAVSKTAAMTGTAASRQDIGASAKLHPHLKKSTERNASRYFVRYSYDDHSGPHRGG